ncbi:MAG: sulfatase-like hydrolase/transferase [Kofleriaceae bacterium]
MASWGVTVFAPIELALTLWAYPEKIEALTAVKLVPLVATYSLWLWLLLRILTARVFRIARFLRGELDDKALVAPGLCETRAVTGVRPNVPKLWAVLATFVVFAGQVVVYTVIAEQRKEPALRVIVIALAASVAAAIARGVYPFALVATRAAADALEPVLGRASPFGRWRAAGVALAGVVGAALIAAWYALPQSRSVMPAREVISMIAIAIGMGFGAMRFDRRPRKQRSRRDALIVAGGAGAVMVITLLYWGADPQAHWLALTGSPTFKRIDDSIRTATDLDRDGYGSLLGENDCAPFDSSIHPGARDIPDDGIDQNCDGHDFSLKTPPVPTGPHLPVPDQFQKKDWNILFITIDTVRYDHTSFGGYLDGPKHRDTTPRLAELVKRSTSFTFCNAPSAGTMASIPAIITSKFFHSGLALDENMPAGSPPKLKPENTTLPEIMKRGGYRTGVIASHEYWNDWGMDQGVDDYDNSIGKVPDPWRAPADKVTDHALAWISKEQGHKWFLWAHYIDPHGRYVAHTDVADWNQDAEQDKYDAEIKWTDQQIGRLLDQLQRLPSTPNTIIVITSDHGDSMGEHTVPLGTHGTALFRELQHVPMIFYIPDNAPHTIGGAVSNLDIVPTLAEITGIDVHDLTFEGKSEVPAIFYNKEDHDRIVFAETNAPTPQRAAISEAWKLIYYLQTNIYELYDLKADPWEHTNLAPKRPPAFDTMKAALDAWLERVVYSRDANFNQANERIKDLVVADAKPAVTAKGQTLDGGKIEILGIDSVAPLKAGQKADLRVYFRTNERTAKGYKFLLAAWPIDPATWKPSDPTGDKIVKSPLRATADGFFPTDRWREKEVVRDKFDLAIPADWKGAVAVGLVANDGAQKAVATGDAPANDPELLVLGTLPLAGP